MEFYHLLLAGLLFAATQVTNTEACGGCSVCGLTDSACYPTLVRTRQVTSSSGWWLGARTVYTTVYDYYKGPAYCCTGYKLNGDRCEATVQNCGGCDMVSINSEPACSQTIQQRISELITVGIPCQSNWWFVYNTCYRQQVQYKISPQLLYTCCSGYKLEGSMCTKDNTPKNCGVSKYPNPGIRLTQIVGGYDAYANEFPWQVRLSIGGGGLCGGTIMDANWILTAAHCVYAYVSNPSTVSVIAGDHNYQNYDTSEQIRYATAVIPHEAYDINTYVNDIALIRLNEALTLNDNVAAACQPESCGENYDNKDVIISGWGRSSAGSKNSPTVRFNTLQFTWVVVKPKAFCESYFGPMGNYLCTSDNQGDTKRSPCFGDSGGPMVIKNANGRFQVIGIASFVADRGCAMGLPSGYTDVRPYLKWIRQYIF